MPSPCPGGLITPSSRSLQAHAEAEGQSVGSVTPLLVVPADSRAVDVHPSANLVADRGGEGPLSADAVHTLEETSRGRHDVVDVSFLLQFYKQPDTIARIAARCGTETLTPIQSTVLASRLSTCSPYFHLCISCSVRELPIATWVMPFQLNAVPC